jgi:DNA polymerase
MNEYLEWLAADGWMACQRCPRLAGNRTQVVPGYGQTVRPILYLLGEAPGTTEDKVGRPFSGRAGLDVLNGLLKIAGVTREEIFIANTCLCRPPANAKPTPTEVYNCLPRLTQEIKMLAPHVIVSMGATPLFALTKQSALAKNRGWKKTALHPKVFITYHPASVFYGTHAEMAAKRAAMEEDWAKIGQAAKELRNETA